MPRFDNLHSDFAEFINGLGEYAAFHHRADIELMSGETFSTCNTPAYNIRVATDGSREVTILSNGTSPTTDFEVRLLAERALKHLEKLRHQMERFEIESENFRNSVQVRAPGEVDQSLNIGGEVTLAREANGVRLQLNSSLYYRKPNMFVPNDSERAIELTDTHFGSVCCRTMLQQFKEWGRAHYSHFLRESTSPSTAPSMSPSL